MMSVPVLNLPKALGARSRRLPTGIIVQRLRKWIRTVDQASDDIRIEQCLDQLAKFNSVHYPVKARLTLLGLLQQSLVEVFKNEKTFVRAALETDEPDLTRLHHLDRLFAEFADGYKLVIQSLAQQAELSETESTQVQEAIYYCLKFLAHRLLLAYAQYTAPAKGIWYEINQIYRYADSNNLLYHIIDDPVSDSSFPVFHSGDFIYKRILLVALVEPYRLMRDECLELYDLCGRWVGACSLLPVNRLHDTEGHLIDLMEDMPPRFVSPGLNWRPQDGRFINIQKVVGRIERDLQKLLSRQAEVVNEFELVRLEERQKRDMLLRILDRYRGKPVRQSKRFVLADDIQFTTGINNCHFHLGNKRHSTPYMDELKHNSAGRHDRQTQAADFGHDYQQALRRDRDYKWTEQALQHALQHNINPLGLAFSCPIPRYPRHQQISVGALIAYRPAGKPTHRWVLGVANWIKRKDISPASMTYDIGIKNLARNAIPVSVRSCDPMAVDKKYYRALLIPKHVSHQQLRSLLVPALSFEVNKELLLNMGRTVTRIKLVRLLTATPAYSQFEFDVL